MERTPNAQAGRAGVTDHRRPDVWRQYIDLRADPVRPHASVMTGTVKVAVVQTAPVPLDRKATTDKVCTLIAEAAAGGARLVLFPEALIPGYPRGLGFGAVVGHRSDRGRELFAQYAGQSLDVPGPETRAIGEAARQAGCWVAVGVIERAVSRGTLYCTLLYFGPDGTLLGGHRKLKPTASERLLWGEGDGSTLTVVKTPFGGVGGLICWENLMPLARTAMYAKGIDIWLAPTADARDSWQATIRHIACEGRCFVLSANQYTTESTLPDGWADDADRAVAVCRGGSAIVGPLGDCLAGPLYDSEGILAAELDLAEIVRARFDFDVMGHYARPDVFTLSVNEAPIGSVTAAVADSDESSAVDQPGQADSDPLQSSSVTSTGAS